MKKTFLSSRQELSELILELTEIAKTKSVLALPEKYNEIDDDFMKYALQSVVDGVDPDTLKAILMAPHIKT